jgi:hypothetical protein
VPGVGALFLGAGADLSRSLGVPQNAPEVEAGFQQVLSLQGAQRAVRVTATSSNGVVRQVREGWKIIRSTVPSITAARATLGER